MAKGKMKSMSGRVARLNKLARALEASALRTMKAASALSSGFAGVAEAAARGAETYPDDARRLVAIRRRAEKYKADFRDQERTAKGMFAAALRARSMMSGAVKGGA